MAQSAGGGLQNTATASLQRGKTPPNECSGYDTKQSDSELWEMWSTLLLPSLPGLLWPEVVAPNRVNGLSISKFGDCSRGRPGSSLFNRYYTEVCGGPTLFPGLLHFTLDPYLIMLSVKQKGIKYHFLSLRAIGKHSI